MRKLCLLVASLLAGCERDLLVLEKPDPVTEVDSDTPPADPAEEAGIAMIEVDPTLISFGDVNAGEVEQATITITNIGDAALDITGINLKGDPGFTSPDVGLSLTLEPGESREVEVMYVGGEGDATADLTVVSTDLSDPEIPVALDAFGALRSVWGDALDFGYVRVGTWVTQPLTLHSDGNRPVTVSRVLSSDGHFSVSLPAPLTIDPGAAQTVEVTFLPDDILTFTGELAITADTPQRPSSVMATGTGADGPIAVCSADPRQVSAIRDTFRFTGVGSWDPTNRPLTYQWTWVSVPRGSSVNTALSGQITARITPDVIGDYVAELVVTNDLGYSSQPCRAIATADADRDLWVEMFWQHAEDIDLHLLRNNGNFNTAQDCYYGNCIGGLSWDTPAALDDPYLDLDDTRRTGPENINIDQPASNRYTVLIHDHPFTAYAPANQVTINVYLYGRLEYQDTRVVTGEGDQVRVVEIDFGTNPPTLTRL